MHRVVWKYRCVRWFTGHLPEQQRNRHSTHTKSIMQQKTHYRSIEWRNTDVMLWWLGFYVWHDDHDVCYYTKSGIFMRKFRPSDAKLDESWRIRYQIVLLQSYRVLSIAHDIPWVGHLGVNKTTDRILQYLFWPCIRGSVANYCKPCHTCQVVCKPNQAIPRAPHHPIPDFDEAFCKVIIVCVEPLPKTTAIMSLWRHCTVHTCFVWPHMLGGVVREHSVRTPNAYYCYFHMDILYVDIYKKKLMDYITWWIYILSHFGSILLCNSNPDADR